MRARWSSWRSRPCCARCSRTYSSPGACPLRRLRALGLLPRDVPLRPPGRRVGQLHRQTQCVEDHRLRGGMARQATLGGLGLRRMAAGDAQRVWFPEMLDDLRAAWSASMTWDGLPRASMRTADRPRCPVTPGTSLLPLAADQCGFEVRCSTCSADPGVRPCRRSVYGVRPWLTTASNQDERCRNSSNASERSGVP